jgi:hypothetical protein
MSCDDSILSRFIAGVAKLKVIISPINFSGKRSDLRSQERSDLEERKHYGKKYLSRYKFMRIYKRDKSKNVAIKI